jgi:hypothetical protein
MHVAQDTNVETIIAINYYKSAKYNKTIYNTGHNTKHQHAIAPKVSKLSLSVHTSAKPNYLNNIVEK